MCRDVLKRNTSPIDYYCLIQQLQLINLVLAVGFKVELQSQLNLASYLSLFRERASSSSTSIFSEAHHFHFISFRWRGRIQARTHRHTPEYLIDRSSTWRDDKREATRSAGLGTRRGGDLLRCSRRDESKLHRGGSSSFLTTRVSRYNDTWAQRPHEMSAWPGRYPYFYFIIISLLYFRFILFFQACALFQLLYRFLLVNDFLTPICIDHFFDIR